MKHAYNAFFYSMAGIGVLFREKAAKLEGIYFFLAIVLLWSIDAVFEEYAITVILFMIMFGMEALNTAIEVLVDHLSPEKSQFAKEAKDLGSAAVFFTIAASTIYLAYLLLRFFNWDMA